MTIPEYWTIPYINERILWLLSEDCPHDEKQRERLIRIAIDIKDYMEKNRIKRIKVIGSKRDFGSKGYQIVTLT